MKSWWGALSVMVMTMIIPFSFVGCNISTENELRKVVVASLEEKYGEEFICRDVKANGGASYFAVCSPTNNQGIKFTTLFLTGGTITYDGYYSSCVAEKIEETVNVQLRGIFSEYYLHSYMTSPLRSRESDDIYVENVKRGALDPETYIDLSKNVHDDETPTIVFYLCVNTSGQGKLSFEEEYDALSDIFSEVDTLGMNSSMDLKFVPEEKYADCVEYLEGSDVVYDTLRSTLEQYAINNPNMPSGFFSFAEGKGKLTLTKEEYINQRKALNCSGQ